MRNFRNFSSLTGVIIMVLSLVAGPITAAQCEIPSGSYPTIQSAVDEISCVELSIQAGVFNESLVISRALTITGAGSSASIINGRVDVTGGVVELSELQIYSAQGQEGSARSSALLVSNGARLSGVNLVVVNTVPVFIDGFETGDTSRWSSVTGNR